MPAAADTPLQIASAALSAAIDPLGAQLLRLRDAGGRDLLWDGDPAWWAGRAPLLFPIVGTLAGNTCRIGGERHELPRHGFARGRRFEVVAASADAAKFRLRDDAATRAAYPFPFELDVDWRVAGAEITCVATVRNTGDTPLPASIGFHPGFPWPLPYGGRREDHVVEFEHEEPAPIRRLTAEGLVAAESFPSPLAGRQLRLDDALFAADVVIWDAPRSRRLRYGVPERTGLVLSFPDARQIGIWTRPGAPFVCLEPWQGHSDPAGFDGEFQHKPGVFLVPPGGEHPHHLRIAIDPR